MAAVSAVERTDKTVKKEEINGHEQPKNITNSFYCVHYMFGRYICENDLFFQIVWVRATTLFPRGRNMLAFESKATSAASIM